MNSHSKDSLTMAVRPARTRRWVAGVLSAVVVIAAIGSAIAIQHQSQIEMPVLPVGTDTAALIKRGAAVATAADCIACHTSDRSRPYAGGVKFATPFGTIYSTNITQDKQHGMGDFSDAEIIGAIRNGISHAGRRLYPAMPYTSYTGMSDQDVIALLAYLRSLQPIDWAPPANSMSFPFNQRWGMAFWNLLNFKAGRQVADATKSQVWQRGAYLVQTLEHCQECHSPRNLLQGVSTPALAGAVVGPWRAYNITSSTVAGIGGWSDQDLIDYLHTGATHGQVRANAAGPMAEVVENSTSKLPLSDLQAMVTYLRIVPAVDSNMASARAGGGQAYAGIEDLRHGQRYEQPGQMRDGATLFNANCATCHAYTGAGVGEYPKLIGNTILGDTDARNLTQVILHGVHRQTPTADVFMPGFDDLSDGQIAALEQFLYRQFGHDEIKPDLNAIHQVR